MTSCGWVHQGLGFEVDFAYHPNFFEPGDDEDVFDFGSNGNVVTFMGNVVFGHEGGGIQPYVAGGFGLMRTNIEGITGLFGDFNDTAFGFNAGGGLRVGGPNVGVRGDLRYFRQLSDIEIVDIGFGPEATSEHRGGSVVLFWFLKPLPAEPDCRPANVRSD